MIVIHLSICISVFSVYISEMNGTLKRTEINVYVPLIILILQN